MRILALSTGPINILVVDVTITEEIRSEASFVIVKIGSWDY